MKDSWRRQVHSMLRSLLEMLGFGLGIEGQESLVGDALGQLKLLWLLRVRSKIASLSMCGLQQGF